MGHNISIAILRSKKLIRGISFILFRSRCSNCASVIHIMEQEMVRANEMKSENNKQKEALEQEVRKTEREREGWWAWPFWFLEVLLFLFTLKLGQIFLRTMDYSPWSSKNLIDRNRLKKIHASRH